MDTTDRIAVAYTFKTHTGGGQGRIDLTLHAPAPWPLPESTLSTFTKHIEGVLKKDGVDVNEVMVLSVTPFGDPPREAGFLASILNDPLTLTHVLLALAFGYALRWLLG